MVYFPYDLVAAYGQIALAVMSLFITIFYKEAQNRVMRSDWGKAAFLRRILFVAVTCFLLLSLMVLLAVVSVDSKTSLMNGNSGISTMLVAVITVVFVATNEPCRIRDILDLRVSEVDIARITALVDDTDSADRSKWQAGCVAVRMFVSNWFRKGRKAWALIREIVGLSDLLLSFPYLDEPSIGRSAEDVIESSKSPPLQLKVADYPLVSGMVRHYVWKMVCACETSYQELYATIRLLQSRYTSDNVAPLWGPVGSDIGLLACYNKVLALLEKGFRSLTSEEYLEELTEFRQRNYMRQVENEPNNEVDVVVQWICHSARFHKELRSWDYAFKTDVQDLLAVCPKSSGYWQVVSKLAKVNDRFELEDLYKEMTSSEDSMKVVYILHALNCYYRLRGVCEMTVTRHAFMENFKKSLKQSMKFDEELKSGLLKVVSIESARNLADIAMLTFMRVGRGWGEDLEAGLVADIAAAAAADEVSRDLDAAHINE